MGSRYGGVWADVTTCPVQPLESYASEKASKVGFFGLMWEPFFKLQKSANHTPGALDGFNPDGPCVGRQKMSRPRADTQGYHTIDTWFLVSPEPHHPIVDAWLGALVTAVKGLPEGATSCRPKHCAVKGDYVYHLVMCVLGQVYVDNAAVRTLIDAMPAESLCQHGGNASPRCEDALASKDEQAAYDQSPDPNKWMYKSFSLIFSDENDLYIHLFGSGLWSYAACSSLDANTLSQRGDALPPCWHRLSAAH